MRESRDTERDKAFNWCLKNHIRIYPVQHPTESHTKTTLSGGKKKRVSLPLCKICIEIESSKQYGKAFYRQEDELYNKINELLIYYYKR